MPTIRPCKKCGGKGKRHQQTPAGVTEYYVMCESCGKMTDLYLNQMSAIKEWNKMQGGKEQ